MGSTGYADRIIYRHDDQLSVQVAYGPASMMREPRITVTLDDGSTEQRLATRIMTKLGKIDEHTGVQMATATLAARNASPDAPTKPRSLGRSGVPAHLLRGRRYCDCASAANGAPCMCC